MELTTFGTSRLPGLAGALPPGGGGGGGGPPNPGMGGGGGGGGGGGPGIMFVEKMRQIGGLEVGGAVSVERAGKVGANS